MKRTLLYTGSWLLISSAAACQPADSPQTEADTTALQSETTVDTTATTDGGVDTVHVVLDEWTVRPQSTSLSPGRVLFHVMNEGEYEHALEVEGGGEEKETDRIPPGGVATVEVDLKTGSYELYCPVEDTHGKHEQLGMRTKLTVR